MLSYLRGAGRLQRTSKHTNSQVSKATESLGKANPHSSCLQTEEIITLASRASSIPCKGSPRGCSKQKLVMQSPPFEARFTHTLAAISKAENNGQNKAPGRRPLRNPPHHTVCLGTCEGAASLAPPAPPDPSSALAFLQTQMPAMSEEDFNPGLQRSEFLEQSICLKKCRFLGSTSQRASSRLEPRNLHF